MEEWGTAEMGLETRGVGKHFLVPVVFDELADLGFYSMSRDRFAPRGLGWGGGVQKRLIALCLL
ncbi:hypothetical protein N7528_006962 [Penicillium herquei]|nr:hypothetical protein N7528_006962 [Penicillium herquei]